ncbi:MAG: DMT family transporter [Roseobacter sp.]|jgi:drug/metabolite transporter (DMT)-like permease
MRLFMLTLFTMLAFASNSLLTRLAVEPGHADAISFALIRVLSGAVFLCLLVAGQGGKLPWRATARVTGAISLAVYMVGFSLAYITLDAGIGALILFGVVQISMFAHGAITGNRPTARQLAGAAIAFGGLLLALWPKDGAIENSAGALLMVLAGLGWAVYTLSGRTARTPLSATAANFALCFPMLMIVTLPFIEQVSPTGVVLAVVCGAITSGLGYALWYRVLPELKQNVAAVVQLSVPIIAIIGGSVVLGETITTGVVASAVLVVSGIALAVTKRSSPTDRS